jgi:PAS domain S-box-containing protein
LASPSWAQAVINFAIRRHVAFAAAIFALTVAAFFLARASVAGDARTESRHDADLATVQVSDNVERASGYVDSLRQVVGGRAAVTQDGFSAFAEAALRPVGLLSAAWVERVLGAERADYERAIGRPITEQSADGRLRRAPVRPVYYPATLTAVHRPPSTLALDWGSVPALPQLLVGSSPLFGVGSTGPVHGPGGERGLYLAESAPRPDPEGGQRQGFVVVFVPARWLLSSPRAPGVDQRVAVTVGGATIGATGTAGEQVRRSFAAVGRRWSVMVPDRAARGADALLPWLILGAGAIVAVLAGVLAANAARRAKAQDELDRIFNLSSDVISVADFEGHFTRVNPAAEQVLGYTQEELIARPYLDFVAPDDRERTAAEAAAIAHGETTRAFENRYVRKDGSPRVIEWRSTPVVEDRVMYSVGRDVTDRRQAETELERLAGEQAALRRVATLVAREAAQAEVFAAIAEGIGQLLRTEEIRMLRYEEDQSAVMVASAGEDRDVFPVGSRIRLDGDSAASRVLRTGRPARIDDYGRVRGPIGETVRSIGIRSVAGAPILVEGRLWGAITAGTRHGAPLPPETESRLAQFTELMATAIANTESHARAERLADEQAALRRVATLVAEGAAPTVVLDAVAAEMERLLEADHVTLGRYEPGDEVTKVAHAGPEAHQVPLGTRVTHEGESVAATVRRTERSIRVDYSEAADGVVAEMARSRGIGVAIGAPIVVEGRLWGVIVASWSREEAPPAGTEQRMAEFAELLDTAIANADSRDQLTASRARLLTAADEARRRVVRDLHDGAQQRLVTTMLTLNLAERALQANDGKVESLICDALAQVKQGNEELRELAHGLLPPVLTDGGLRAGVDSVVRRLDVPIEVDVPGERFPAEIEASAYFIVAEALTNVVKHADARHAEVRAFVDDGMFRVEVRDDGIGGADPDGRGLIGLRDRATALGGRLDIESPASGGTLVAATLPLSGR